MKTRDKDLRTVYNNIIGGQALQNNAINNSVAQNNTSVGNSTYNKLYKRSNSHSLQTKPRQSISKNNFDYSSIIGNQSEINPNWNSIQERKSKI